MVPLVPPDRPKLHAPDQEVPLHLLLEVRHPLCEEGEHPLHRTVDQVLVSNFVRVARQQTAPDREQTVAFRYARRVNHTGVFT